MGSTVPQGKHHASEALPRELRYRVVRGRLYHRPKSGFHQFGHRPSLHRRLGFDPSVKIISNVQGGSHTCRKADACVSFQHQTLSQTNPSNEAAPQTEDLKTEDRRQKTGKLDLLSSPWVGIHSVSRKEAQKPQKMNTFRLIAYLAHFCG
jgi:hypothetical protein